MPNTRICRASRNTIRDFDPYKRGDCALVAASIIRPKLVARSIIEAFHQHAEYGVTGKGSINNGISGALKALGIRHRRVMFGVGMNPTVAQFARRAPRGTFYVIIRGHALVIRDGLIIDPNFTGPRSKPAIRSRVWKAFYTTNEVRHDHQ